MPILLVNTAYKPDRGGSTMIVDGIARTLSRETPVFVFCGRLHDPSQPRYSAVDYTVGDVWVRSVNLTREVYDPFQRVNYFVPQVNEILADLLDEVQPDLIHFHSLEWLGAGVVEEALRRDIPTILTMHDWWWLCPNQFLADGISGQVCSFDVPSNDCCQRHPIMNDRQAYLLPLLRRVDRITVPSQTLRDSLLRSGIDFKEIEIVPDRVLPPGRERRCRKENTYPIRFGYLGGRNWFKGYGVLMRAAEDLDPDKARVMIWDPLVPKAQPTGAKSPILTLLNAIMPKRSPSQILRMLLDPQQLFSRAFIGKLSVRLRTLWRFLRHRGRSAVEFYPGFSWPEEVDDVYDQMDILLVPSNVRESFSLAAREAMVRGVPVICSDSGGPEEVVQDGVNGLVCRIGDAADLRAEMEQVIAQPGLVEEWASRIDASRIPLDPYDVSDWWPLYEGLVPASCLRSGEWRLGCQLLPEHRQIVSMPHQRAIPRQSGSQALTFYLDRCFVKALQRLYAGGSLDNSMVSDSDTSPLAVHAARAVTQVGLLQRAELLPVSPAAVTQEQSARQVVTDRFLAHGCSASPRISVIIVNWNGKHLLEECLSSLMGQTLPPSEVILVDNGSDDGSAEFVEQRYPEVQLVRNPANWGFCRGNMVGIDKAGGEWLFLLNNDTWLEPTCLEGLAAQMQASPADRIGVFPKVVFYDAPQVINALGTFWNYRHHWRDFRVGLLDVGQFNMPEAVFGSLFAAVLLDRAHFERIRGFDEAFFSYGEDFDVCYRANLMGHRFYTAPRAVVHHKYRGSAREEADPLWSEFHFRRNYLMVFIKNYEFANLLRYGPIIIGRYFGASFLRALVRRDRRRLRMFAHIVSSLMVKMPHLLQQRRQIQRLRCRRDAELWDWRDVEDYNVFHYEDAIVLNTWNLQTALGTTRFVTPSEPVVAPTDYFERAARALEPEV